MGYILKVTTDNQVEKIEGDKLTLEFLQESVKGYIEPVNPCRLYFNTGIENACMLVNGDGLNLKLDLNLFGSFLYGTDIHLSPIVGDIVFVGLAKDKSDFCELDDTECTALEKLINDFFAY